MTPMKEQLRTPVLLCSLPALLLSAVCLLPYLGKAFLIDDPFFLQQAQYIRKAPLHPTMVDICWVSDNMCGPIAGTAPNNLLMSYFLVPVVATGGHEWLAHLMQLFTLWIAIVATVSLAFRFGFSAFAACAAGLILAATPPVLAMASTAMPDTLAMSLGVIGIERLLAWRQEGKPIQALLGALALGLAAFTRLHMVLLWPCAALLLRDNGRVLDFKGWLALKNRWLPLAAAVLVFGIAHALTHEPGTTIGPTQNWLAAENVYRNSRAYLIDWILAMPLGLAWLILRNRHLRLWLLVAPCILAIWTIWTRPLNDLWTPLCACLGIVVLIDIFLWAFQGQEQRRILCALWLLLPLAALEYIHLPVKYLVVCAPAGALLIGDILPDSRWRIAAVTGIAAAGVIFGSMVLHTDAKFAEMGREAAVRLIAPRVAAGQRVWLASQWGFQWYALKAGARLLRPNDVLAPGDYLARGEVMEGWNETMKRLPPAVVAETYTVAGAGGRTMSSKDHAGLYSNNFGYGVLMWAWGSGEWNRYELWQFR